VAVVLAVLAANAIAAAAVGGVPVLVVTLAVGLFQRGSIPAPPTPEAFPAGLDGVGRATALIQLPPP
jgi:hypothetical protein